MMSTWFRIIQPRNHFRKPLADFRILDYNSRNLFRHFLAAFIRGFFLPKKGRAESEQLFRCSCQIHPPILYFHEPDGISPMKIFPKVVIVVKSSRVPDFPNFGGEFPIHLSFRATEQETRISAKRSFLYEDDDRGCFQQWPWNVVKTPSFI